MSLKSHEIKQSQHAHQSFRVTPKPFTSRKAILDKSYWPSVANLLRAGDHISILAQDNSFYMEVLVLFVNGTDVRVEEISYKEFDVDEAQFDEHPEYEVKNGGATGFYIRNRETGERVNLGSKSTFGKRSQAHKALEEYLSKLKAA